MVGMPNHIIITGMDVTMAYTKSRTRAFSSSGDEEETGWCPKRKRFEKVLNRSSKRQTASVLSNPTPFSAAEHTSKRLSKDH
jgi:hypothetical protein